MNQKTYRNVISFIFFLSFFIERKEKKKKNSIRFVIKQFAILIESDLILTKRLIHLLVINLTREILLYLDRTERFDFWSRFLLFIPLFFFPLFFRREEKRERNNQSSGQKSCCSILYLQCNSFAIFWIRQYPYKSQLFHVMLYTRSFPLIILRR